MKRKIILVFIIASAVCLFAFSSLKQESSRVIMIRGYIMISLMGGKNISTIKVYDGSTTEIIELGKINSKTAFDESVNEVVATVNKYAAQGYTVQSSTEVPGNAVVIFNYTLSK